MFHYQINPDSEIPIYRQLVDQINAQIRSGALPTGTQLPTVRELAEKLHLSCGTVKHVYDRLQEMGNIEMTRRRGTFVKYVRHDTDSRKQQAMYAIDHMIRKLSELHFSPAEIQIFLNLKMREWGLKWSGIRIAVITEYTETAETLRRQLEQIGNVDVNVYPLSQLRAYPYNVDEQNDVILASAQDAQKLSLLLPDMGKVIRVAFHTDPACVAALAGCHHEKIGVACESEGFFDLVKSYLQRQEGLFRLDDCCPEDLDALVVADGYEDPYIKIFRGPIYAFSHRLDEGSMLYLEERINKIRDERQLWPGTLRV